MTIQYQCNYMDRKDLSAFNAWFADYAAGFYKSDSFVNANLKLKEEHTQRVCAEMRYLVEQLNLDECDCLIAETIALFHDVGRYEQFTQYKTFSDKNSVPHGPLSVEVLKQYDVLSGLSEGERQMIYRAIVLHSVKEVPGDLDDRTDIFARLIRDADKLDILYLVVEVDSRPKDPSQERLMINWFEESDDYSKEIITALLNCEMINYNLLRTQNDMRLMQIGWTYDMNFVPTFQRLKRKRYIEKIIEMLPAADDIARASGAVLEYIDRQVESICREGKV